MKQWLPILVGALILLGFGALLIVTRESRVTVPETNEQKEIAPHSASLPSSTQLTVEEFRTLANEVAKSLPTKQDLSHNAEVQLSPGPVLKAAERLGQISKAVYDQPSLGEEALIFYLDCANAQVYPDSVRALCFANYTFLVKKLGLKRDNSVPLAIRQLAEKLVGL